jgi:hypothetical protein
LIVGVLACVFVVGWTLLFLNRNLSEIKPAPYDVILPAEAAATQTGPDGAVYAVRHVGAVAGIPDGVYLADSSGRVHYEVVQGIGSKNASAPQARLMSLVIRGILTRQLPWGLVLIGVFLSVILEMVGVPALAFAVGVYLPLESTTPVYVGGLVRWLIDKQRGSDSESDSGPGILYASGLIAGASLMGLVYAGLQPENFKAMRDSLDLGKYLPAALVQGPLLGLLTFGLISWLLYRAARSDGAAKA